MKKLLALLLAFMLPCCALAEAHSVMVRLSTDGAAFTALAREVVRGLPGMTAKEGEIYVQVLRAILKDARVTTVIQDDTASVEINLSGKSLLDLVIYHKEDGSYITTSMLPGYAFVLQQDEMRLRQNGPSQLDEAALNAIAGSVETAVAAWLKRLAPTVAYGTFQGDAYEGGTKCTAWVLSDKDIAAFVSAVATDEVRAAVTQLLKKSGVDAVRLLKQFDDLNHRVSDENLCVYILRVVHDKDHFVGLSLTILAEKEQIAEISFGRQENELRLVVRLGTKARNYWRRYAVQANQRERKWKFCGSSRVWAASKAEVLSCVSEMNASVNACIIWSSTVSQSGEQYLWEAALYEGVTADENKKLASCTGSFTPVSKLLNADFNLVWLSSTPLKMQLSVEPAQEIPPLDPSLVICSVGDPEDAVLYDKLNKKLANKLMRRLLTQPPLYLLLTLVD